MFNIFKYAALIVIALGAFCIVGFSFGSGKPFKHLILNALSGIIAFTCVALTARYTGVHLALNPWTATGISVFGIPAVFFFVIINLIFLI